MNWIASNLLANWDYKLFREQATTGLLKQTDHAGFDSMHDKFDRGFGPMIHYDGAHGVTRVYGAPRDGISEIADYSSVVYFTRGSGTLYVTAVKANGHWRLDGFRVKVGAERTQ